MLIPTLFGRAAPATLSPMVFPWTAFAFVPVPLIETPRPVLPEMTLRAPATVPPIVFEWAPPNTATPAELLARAAVPVVSVPMKLPVTTLSLVPTSAIRMPWPVLPEMTLAAPAAVPPTVFDLAPPRMAIPPSVLGTAAAPVALRPTTFPRTRFVLVAPPVIATPLPPFPEIRLPSPVPVSPTRLLRASPVTHTPAPVFGTAAVPAWLVPM